MADTICMSVNDKSHQIPPNCDSRRSCSERQSPGPGCVVTPWQDPLQLTDLCLPQSSLPPTVMATIHNYSEQTQFVFIFLRAAPRQVLTRLWSSSQYFWAAGPRQGLTYKCDKQLLSDRRDDTKLIITPANYFWMFVRSIWCLEGSNKLTYKLWHSQRSNP